MIGIVEPVASVGRLTFSITDRRNSSLRKKLYVTFPSDTTGRVFRKSKTTLARVPMVSESRSPPTNVITELQPSLNLRKIILTGNNPDGPSSGCCKFPVVFSLPVSSAVRCRVLCRKTIGVVSNYTDDGIDRSLFIYCDSDRFLQRESKLIEKMA